MTQKFRLKRLFSVLTVALTVSHASAMALTSVSARQRYPWNGKVNVDVAFEGPADNAYRIELSATDRVGGTNLTVTTVWRDGAEGVVGNPVDVPAPGTHRLVWDAAADLPSGFVTDRVVLSAKLLNPIWSFESIPAIDTSDVWAPETVYHDVQTVASYGEIEDHAPAIRCLTDEWHLEDRLGANVVFSGASMALRTPVAQHRIALSALSDSANRGRVVTLDYETGVIAYDNYYPYNDTTRPSDVRFFTLKGDDRLYAVVARAGYHAVVKSANTDLSAGLLNNRWGDDETGSAVCSYFPKGIPYSDAARTTILSSLDKDKHAGIFFCGVAGTDRKQTVYLGGGSPKIATNSVYSCMKNPTGRYVVPMLDGTNYFTVGHGREDPNLVQFHRLFTGDFRQWWGESFDLGGGYLGYDPNGWDERVQNWVREPSVAYSKGVAMPDGRRIFLGGAGRDADGKVRMWQDGTNVYGHANYPAGHPFESWARRDITCLLPNGKYCGVDEKLGLVVVNPLTGEMYVASDDPVFKKGKMGCQLLPNGKVWIIPYDCEGREYLAGTNLCGKLYEVDFGFTKSFSLSSLCSPYLKVAEGDPEPSGIKVGLDPNGGELPGIYAQYYKGANPKYGTLPTPALTGHTFRGWSTDGTAARVVAATASVPSLGILLKAAWQANTYTVKFNANGGSGSMADESFSYNRAKALTANAFTRTGYTFAGWATSATGTVVYTNGQSVLNLTATANGTVDLYAKWTANTYAVTLDRQSGSGGSTSATATYGSAMPSITVPTRTGYAFGGYYTAANGGGTQYYTAAGASARNWDKTAATTLYAKWTGNAYSVKFNANTTGTTGSMSNESFSYGTAKALTANAFKKTGYTFAGWATSATGAKAYNDKQTVSNLTATANAVVDLYGLWTTNRYTVRYNKNATDATGTMANQGFPYDYEAGLRAIAFARTGYTFAGWATSATGAKVYDNKQKVKNLSATNGATVDLYAVWTPITYSVKFNANGGSGTMSNESFTYGTAKALTANAFKRTGYTFAGWATSATGAKVYNDKQSVSNLTATANGTVNLYAVWTKALYMVLDLSGGASATSYPVTYLSAVPSGGWTDEYKTTKLVLRRITAGTFTMGSPSGELGRYDNETQHSVTLTKDYFIGVFEVTQRQWELVMGDRPSYFSNATYYKTRPVERVSYNAIRGSSASAGAGWPGSSAVDSTSFIGRVRTRTGMTQFDLPTEAQWEYACRAGTTAAFSNGINLDNMWSEPRIDSVCWHNQDYAAASPSSGWGYGTDRVGDRAANPWGLYDMHGNVWEWCLDWHTANLGTSAVTDPKGPSSGTHRVIRSGAWECAPFNCRSARRGYEPPSATKESDPADPNKVSDGHFGFRLAITP